MPCCPGPACARPGPPAGGGAHLAPPFTVKAGGCFHRENRAAFAAPRSVPLPQRSNQPGRDARAVDSTRLLDEGNFALRSGGNGRGGLECLRQRGARCGRRLRRVGCRTRLALSGARGRHQRVSKAVQHLLCAFAQSLEKQLVSHAPGGGCAQLGDERSTGIRLAQPDRQLPRRGTRAPHGLRPRQERPWPQQPAGELPRRSPWQPRSARSHAPRSSGDPRLRPRSVAGQAGGP